MPSLDFSTTTCRSAYAATCGRWVTTSTWALLASSASRRPTSTAARPPTPASTSSKTNVGTGLVPASATSMASITRDSSPPEAPLASGRAGEPVLAASWSSTSSSPAEPNRSHRFPTSSAPGCTRGPTSCWATSTLSRASGIASSAARRSPRRPALGPQRAAPCRRARPRRAPARRAASRLSARSRSIRPSVSSRSSSRAADCSAQASTSSMVSPYLRVSAVSAARRSETVASRAGSVSSREAYDATSAARSESR